MTVDRAWANIADRISDPQVLALEQSAIRIPSTTFEKGSCRITWPATCLTPASMSR
jgi:hypothetical protein